MDLDLDAIRARAIAAGGAEARWKTYQSGGVENCDGDIVVYDEGAPTEEQAAHIAGMDPATTLALLDEIERLKDEIDSFKNEYTIC